MVSKVGDYSGLLGLFGADDKVGYGVDTIILPASMKTWVSRIGLRCSVFSWASAGEISLT